MEARRQPAKTKKQTAERWGQNNMLDIKKAKENLRKREEMKKQARLKRFEAATVDFSAIVQMIIDRYSPKKIVQWGSLLLQD